MSVHTSTQYGVVELSARVLGGDSCNLIDGHPDALNLQHAQRVMQMGCLASSIAHSMNNLLMVIEGSVDLAVETLPTNHVAHQDLATISQASRRSIAMIRQLLNFVRHQPTLPLPIHLGDVLAGIDLLAERILLRNITLIRDIAPDLWLTLAAAGQIEQIMVNLLTNARDAMPQGGVVAIRAENYVDEFGVAYVRLEIIDTGVGVAPELQQRVFEPFYTTKDADKGAGLGLTICAMIVEQLGGRISLDSTVSQGTTVSVLLPKAN